jgi:hypothetical protein
MFSSILGESDLAPVAGELGKAHIVYGNPKDDSACGEVPHECGRFVVSACDDITVVGRGGDLVYRSGAHEPCDHLRPLLPVRGPAKKNSKQEVQRPGKMHVSNETAIIGSCCEI